MGFEATRLDEMPLVCWCLGTGLGRKTMTKSCHLVGTGEARVQSGSQAESFIPRHVAESFGDWHCSHIFLISPRCSSTHMFSRIPHCLHTLPAGDTQSGPRAQSRCLMVLIYMSPYLSCPGFCPLSPTVDWVKSPHLYYMAPSSGHLRPFISRTAWVFNSHSVFILKMGHWGPEKGSGLARVTEHISRNLELLEARDRWCCILTITEKYEFQE